MANLTTSQIKARVSVINKLLAYGGHNLNNVQHQHVQDVLDELWAEYPNAAVRESDGPVVTGVVTEFVNNAGVLVDVEKAEPVEETGDFMDVAYADFNSAYDYFKKNTSQQMPLHIITDASTEEYIVTGYGQELSPTQTKYSTPREIERLRLRCLNSDSFEA